MASLREAIENKRDEINRHYWWFTRQARGNPPPAYLYKELQELEEKLKTNPKYHRTPQGHTYGTRIRLFSLLYVPRKGDTDVIEFLLWARKEGINITQLITDAIRLLMENKK